MRKKHRTIISISFTAMIAKVSGRDNIGHASIGLKHPSRHKKRKNQKGRENVEIKKTNS